MNTIPTEQCQSDLERFGMTTCAECSDLIHQDEAVQLIYYHDGWQETETFCCEDCKYHWYINRLNTLGM